MTTSTTSTSTDLNNSSTDEHDQDNKKYHLVLYGATSFVGQITAAYLADFLPSQPIRWAIAGRNQEKLTTLRHKLQQQLTTKTDDVKREISKTAASPDAPESILPDILLANSDDEASLATLCQQSKIIISTVGPYLNYGEPLIKACVTHGTDYVDLTGEAIFIKDMMDRYQQQAKQTGSRIVNSCGFDSIPSDLGVYFTQQQAQQQFGAPCHTIEMRVKAAKGGLSGGTIASMATIFAAVGKDKNRRKQLSNPYLLNDDTNPPAIRQPSHSLPSYDEQQQRWLAPFIMDSINTRIVHHSNQLLAYAYGRDFKYDEAMWMPTGLKGRVMSYAMTAAIGGFAAAMSFDKSRELLSEHVLPKSGDGPSEEEQKNGYFDLRFFGQTQSGDTLVTKVTGDKDPGYGSTSQMLAQAALCLLQDVDHHEIPGGFWTPASAMGDKLIERLRNHAGLEFALLETK